MLKFPQLTINNPLKSWLKPKAVKVEYFLSLYVGPTEVEGGVWKFSQPRLPEVMVTAGEKVAVDNWDDRIQAVDTLLGKLEETTGPDTIKKVVLGFPAIYLTQSGDIDKTVRPHIKKLTHLLDLEAIGFVALHQALTYKLKKDEGVPPTVVLVGCFGTNLTVHIYKIGQLAGQRTEPLGEDVVLHLEEMLKSFTDIEVLPSRLLLYGQEQESLNEIQSRLLKHPWQNRANFMHFPRIDVVEKTKTVWAISMAGASELASEIVEEPAAESVVVDEQTDKPMKPDDQEEVKTEAPAEEPQEVMEAEVMSEEDVLEEQEESTGETDANVVVVQPEALGFHQKPVGRSEPEVETEAAEEIEEEKKMIPIWQTLMSRLAGEKKPIIPVVALVFAILVISGGIYWIYYWLLPSASVIVYALPKTIEETGAIIIDTEVSSVDAEAKVIPGHKPEKIVSGEKVVPATGKKKIGDPAKGSVSIFNKSTSSRTFRKGSVLSASSLEFTLDSEVQVASASENLVSGTVTFGKGTGTVTAANIGPAGNLPSGTEFIFKEVPSVTAIARSEAAFAGGSSRDVTVVSRTDNDTLVKELTNELTTKAKEELKVSVSGSEKLIESTINANVTEKVFGQEVGQEAGQLQGKLTITVTGVSYREDDIRGLLDAAVSSQVPGGYALDSQKTEVDINEATVKKDGKIIVTAAIRANALPTLESNKLQMQLAGKRLGEAESYLRTVSGIGGVEFNFDKSPWRDRLPPRPGNIKIKVVAFE